MTSLVSPKDMISSGLCIGCGACAGQAGAAAVRLDWDGEGQLRPFGPRGWETARTEQFSRLCPFSPGAANEDAISGESFSAVEHVDPWIGRFEAAYVGYAAEHGFRDHGSSGGMASWVAAELLRQGMVDGVAHVAPCDPQEDGRFFRYSISRDLDALNEGAKSRYHPVELSGVLREMSERPGRYAVVGIPCFIKAVHLARREDAALRDRIVYTLGLVCGHMKSRHMVDSFAWQMGVDMRHVDRVDYRVKNAERPANWYTARIGCRDGGEHLRDWWHLVDGDWGSGFFQNRACDYCDDVVGETADICFGDAWVEPYSSDGRGTNVVVVRSPVLHGLLKEGMEQGRVALESVDAAFVKETQAAGFRQRREGLAYRLAWRKRGVKPRKRVEPSRAGLSWRRKLIYRMRHFISRGSARAFAVAEALEKPRLFLAWGRGVLTLYHALAYSRGRLGRLLDRIEGVRP